MRRSLSEKTSIKDVIEACGVPHPEVDLILCDGVPVGFAHLEPLTRLYYHDFRECDGCGAVYWPGSHFPKLQARLDRIKAAAG